MSVSVGRERYGLVRFKATLRVLSFKRRRSDTDNFDFKFFGERLDHTSEQTTYVFVDPARRHDFQDSLIKRHSPALVFTILQQRQIGRPANPINNDALFGRIRDRTDLGTPDNRLDYCYFILPVDSTSALSSGMRPPFLANDKTHPIRRDQRPSAANVTQRAK